MTCCFLFEIGEINAPDDAKDLIFCCFCCCCANFDEVVFVVAIIALVVVAIMYYVPCAIKVKISIFKRETRHKTSDETKGDEFFCQSGYFLFF